MRLSTPSMTCTSMLRVKGTPRAQIASLHTNSPALPPGLRWLYSISKTKLRYWRSVRMTPVGDPVHAMTGLPASSLPTLHVEGEVFTLVQPARSLPLKSGSQPSGLAACSRAKSTVKVPACAGDAAMAASRVVAACSAGASVAGLVGAAHATRIEVTEHAAIDATRAEVCMRARYRRGGQASIVRVGDAAGAAPCITRRWSRPSAPRRLSRSSSRARPRPSGRGRLR